MDVFLKDVLKLRPYVLRHIWKVVSSSECSLVIILAKFGQNLGDNCVEQNLIDRDLVLVHSVPIQIKVSMKHKSNIMVLLVSCKAWYTTDIFRCCCCFIT